MANPKHQIPDYNGRPIRSITTKGPDMMGECPVMVITFKDGGKVRIHANDLGQWEEELCPEGLPYQSWSSLFGQCHNYFSGNPQVELLPNRLRLTWGDVSLELDLTADKVVNCPWTEKVITHPQGLDLISDAAACGCFWRMMFNSHTASCPPELHLECAPEDLVPSL